ncbi:MAG: hypothetical protein N3F64_04835 [Nitrososphaeria archaeon]|nr:hypothetical protein [Nitrososphaeria archaeon]
MGVVERPENFRKIRKLPPYIEDGLKDLGPLGKVAKEIIISNYDEFKNLSFEKVKEKLEKEYKIKFIK